MNNSAAAHTPTPPKDPRLISGQFGPTFGPLCRAADAFWKPRLMARRTDETRCVLVELLSQDFRVALRNLSMAMSIATTTGARVIAVVGAEPQWNEQVWRGYDATGLAKMARSWQAADVVDLNAAVAAVQAGAHQLKVAGATVPVSARMALPGRAFNRIVDATWARIAGLPGVTRRDRRSDGYARLRDHSELSTRVWEALCSQLNPIAFVTSHVDYTQWAPALLAAGRAGAETVHVQSTGGLKAYRARIDDDDPGAFRRTVTQRLGTYFEEQVWPRRHELSDAAELVAWRARQNHGAPSWWRASGEDDEVSFRTAAERDDLRAWAARRLRLPADRPLIGVFNHAVSDALGSNHEAFPSLAEWFRRTTKFAARHPEVSWLLIDHPSQRLYDRSGFFESLAEQYAGADHLRFMQSTALAKDELWSLVDLAVTVRGSVSNEFPAFGTPALQAGWSEWSHCGFTLRGDTPRSYWRELRRAIEVLREGGSLITPEQTERARLFMWFYRSGSDVTTPLIPHWNLGVGAQFDRDLGIAMRSLESDSDPLLTRVSKWWQGSEPALTRADPPRSTPASEPGTSTVRECEALTKYDEPIDAWPVGTRVTSGEDPRIAFLTGTHRGSAILGRAWKPAATLGFRLGQDLEAPAQLKLKLVMDTMGDDWWEKEHEGCTPPSSRRVHVTADGVVVARLDIAHGDHVVEVPVGARRSNAMVIIEFTSEGAERGVIGLRFDSADFTTAPLATSSGQRAADPVPLSAT